jgi:hypothetical protein
MFSSSLQEAWPYCHFDWASKASWFFYAEYKIWNDHFGKNVREQTDFREITCLPLGMRTGRREKITKSELQKTDSDTALKVSVTALKVSVKI